MGAIEELRKAKQVAINEILNDDSKDRIDKLIELTENDLWPVEDWLSHLFREWEKDCVELEKKAAIADGKDPDKDYVCSIVDDYFVLNEVYHNRHETVHFYKEIENLLGCNKKKELVAVSNRGEYNSKVMKKPQEIIDKILDYCFENKTIGCVVDW